MKNRQFSEETISKMKNSHTGKKLTDEHRSNISKAVKLRGGFPHSAETKKHLSEIRKGKANPNHAEYMKLNNPNSQRVSILGVEYNSIKSASIALGITVKKIITRLNSNKDEYINWIKL
jgi:hypothetical protein